MAGRGRACGGGQNERAARLTAPHILGGMPSLVADQLARHHPQDPVEATDLQRIRGLTQQADNPWDRAHPLHITASALIVHPETRRVLLRWHERQQAWLQVGGHADPGEADPIDVALREGREETGLTDLTPWPDASLLHVAIVAVPARGDEPAHEHADLRFLLATDSPGAATPEKPSAPLRWLTVPEARELAHEANVHEMLTRAERLLDR